MNKLRRSASPQPAPTSPDEQPDAASIQTDLSLPGILGSAANFFLGFLVNPSSAGSSTESLQVAIGQLIGELNYLQRVVSDLAVDQKFLAKGGLGTAEFINRTAVKLANDYSTTIGHLVDNVIPNTLSWLEGQIYSQAIVPLRQRADHLEARAAALEDWEGDIKVWRSQTVDPTLRDWRDWYAFWRTWPLATITTVYDWLNHPSDFADLWTEVLVTPIVDSLVSGQHETRLQTLTSQIIDHAPFNWRHIDAALVALMAEQID